MVGLSVEDRLAIEELVARYNHATDYGDADARAATFTEDGVFTSGDRVRTGREEVRQSPHHPGWQHWTGNYVIKGAGDEATLTCYLTLYGVSKPRHMRITGVYRDVLRKVDGEWLFASRTFTAD